MAAPLHVAASTSGVPPGGPRRRSRLGLIWLSMGVALVLAMIVVGLVTSDDRNPGPEQGPTTTWVGRPLGPREPGSG